MALAVVVLVGVTQGVARLGAQRRAGRRGAEVQRWRGETREMVGGLRAVIRMHWGTTVVPVRVRVRNP